MTWRITQSLVWLLGIFILSALLIAPSLGIQLFWNILIPIAPLLLVVATGLWRNICPLATTVLLPSKFKRSQKRKPSLRLEGYLSLAGVLGLLLIIPSRHAIFNTNGPATATLILILALIALLAGCFFEQKSLWCSGLCPVHPVEKLYGMRNRHAYQNAHCQSCYKCVLLCPDASTHTKPFAINTTRSHRLAGFLMVGGFPGYVWGWFQVPDIYNASKAAHLLLCYKLPLLGLLISSLGYLFARRFLREDIAIPVFATASVACYYWYRLPALFGFGLFPGEGMLVDLSAKLPVWIFQCGALALALFFLWWLVLGPKKKEKWVLRPAFAKK